MDYRSFGRTGVRISPLTFGTMLLHEVPDAADAARLLDDALDAGVNAVDTDRVPAASRPGRSWSRSGRRRSCTSSG